MYESISYSVNNTPNKPKVYKCHLKCEVVSVCLLAVRLQHSK